MRKIIAGSNIAMSKVVAIMSMSLDGYVADLNDGVAEVFDWYTSSGDVEIRTGGGDAMTFHVSQPSADHLHGLEQAVFLKAHPGCSAGVSALQELGKLFGREAAGRGDGCQGRLACRRGGRRVELRSQEEAPRCRR